MINTDKSPSILYLVHDLQDAAVAKRVRMFELGGAATKMAGFRCLDRNFSSFRREEEIEFATTRNGNFLQRVLSVVATIKKLDCYTQAFAGTNIIVARNLEMLAIAVFLVRRMRTSIPIVYEVLDIHRLMLKRGLIGVFLRFIEKTLMKNIQLIITSSPAYIDEYFVKINRTSVPILLLENKLLFSDKIATPTPIGHLASPPWIIGWFGIIRCKESLRVLANLVEASDNQVKIVIRGRPALDQIPDFHEIVQRTNGIDFLGPYAATDLSLIYSDVDLVWAIDMYEKGLNSTWLLPNRLYEGCYFGAVPVAQMNVETGKYLKKLGIGLVLDDPLEQSLKTSVMSLTAQNFKAAAQRVRTVPREQWCFNQNDCEKLVKTLSSLSATQ